MKHILKKELTRVFQDKKLVFSLYILPIMIMFFVYLLFQFYFNVMIEENDRHVPIIYIQNAPEEFRSYIGKVKFIGSTIYLEGDYVHIGSEKGEQTVSVLELKEWIVDGRIDMLVSFDKEFMNKIKQYKEFPTLPEVKTYYNPNEAYSVMAREKFMEKVLIPYKNSILKERFDDLNQFKVFDIDRDIRSSELIDTERGDTRALSTMLPYLLLMLLFSGPMNLGIDIITGEKERGTMAWLLLTPITRRNLVYGKVLAISILSILSSLVYSLSMVLGLPDVSGTNEGQGNLVLKISAMEGVQLVVVMVSLVFLYVTVVSVIAVYSRTVKEANSYLSSAYIVIILIGLLSMYSTSIETNLVWYGVPIYGSALCIQKITMGKLEMTGFAINIFVTLLLASFLIRQVTKAFYKDKIMFHA